MQALELARLLAGRGAPPAEVADLLWPFRGHISIELRVLLARALFQSRNVAEFFAVAYEDYLCNLYRLPSAREAGFEYLAPVFAFIEQLTV